MEQHEVGQRMPLPVCELAAPEEIIECLHTSARHVHCVGEPGLAKNAQGELGIRAVVLHEQDLRGAGQLLFFRCGHGSRYGAKTRIPMRRISHVRERQRSSRRTTWRDQRFQHSSTPTNQRGRIACPDSSRNKRHGA
jgi:hypothetical protein